MVELDFAVSGAEVERHAAAPLLYLKLRLTNSTPATPVRNVMLQCQIRIEPARRSYEAGEREPLRELFGAPDRWGDTLHSMLWTHASALVPAFEVECAVDLPVPCSYDFNIAATKYFYGLEQGEAPLSLLFSGSVFYQGSDEQLQIVQIGHHKEAEYRLPVGVWEALMERYYPDSAWLRLRRDVFDRIYRYKRDNGLASWEHALEHLLDRQSAGRRP